MWPGFLVINSDGYAIEPENYRLGGAG